MVVVEEEWSTEHGSQGKLMRRGGGAGIETRPCQGQRPHRLRRRALHVPQPARAADCPRL